MNSLPILLAEATTWPDVALAVIVGVCFIAYIWIMNR